jgi:hypothetical protein
MIEADHAAWATNSEGRYYPSGSRQRAPDQPLAGYSVLDAQQTPQRGIQALGIVRRLQLNACPSPPSISVDQQSRPQPVRRLPMRDARIEASRDLDEQCIPFIEPQQRLV